jgi:hypothetical protein
MHVCQVDGRTALVVPNIFRLGRLAPLLLAWLVMTVALNDLTTSVVRHIPPAADLTAIVLGAVSLVLCGVAVWRWDANRLVLTCDGVQIPTAFGSISTDWEGIDDVVASQDRLIVTLRLTEAAATSQRGFVLGRHREFELRLQLAEGQRIALTIKHYKDHPENRAAIGTWDGYERLFLRR